ncbi:MAG: DUF4254 domain-containing protein [Flavobacteriaceae bacterium]|nr:DUF4254 domain-containing protein [Flavobacteriaceae bacterium]|tara:strand:+ start:1226 stop:1834 length:609 start_codon:yes stop_codon:yes gene_type:complete
MFSSKVNSVFQEAISSYKVLNSVDQSFQNKYDKDQDLIAHLLFKKCWIDTIQWAYEDIIRDPNIDPESALKLKRMIDASNQERTDMVEFIDGYFLDVFKDVEPIPSAKVNSESPAWAIDRLSILALKIYHMQLETVREDASQSHRSSCLSKLNILLEQRTDLSTAIDDLLEDIGAGKKFMKVYKQMKMYNDDELNPVLRGNK